MEKDLSREIKEILSKLIDCRLFRCWRYLETELFCFAFYKENIGERAFDPSGRAPIVFSLHAQCFLERYSLSDAGAVLERRMNGDDATESFTELMTPFIKEKICSVQLLGNSTLYLDFDKYRLAFSSPVDYGTELWRVFPWPNGTYHMVAYWDAIEIEEEELDE